MRKIFTFLLALAASVGMSWALTPLSGDTWDEDTKTLTVNSNPGTDAYSSNECNEEIEHLIISDAVTSIGTKAFYGCSKLTSIEIPNSVVTIGEWAFRGCGTVTLTLGNSVQSIQTYAFYNTKILGYLTLPASVTSIGNNAFQGSGVTTIISEAVTPPTLATPSPFMYVNPAHIYVPEASVNAYKEAAVWSNNASVISAAPAFYTVALKEGTVNADKVTIIPAKAEENATITVTPVKGYEFTAFAAKYNSTEEAAATLTPKTGAYSFTMPAANVTIEAVIAEKPAPDPANPKAVETGTKGGFSYTLYDTGLLEISGSGAMPSYAFVEGDFSAEVKNIRFAKDCEVSSLGSMWFRCYSSDSQLETVEINSVVPIAFYGDGSLYYRQDGAVTITIKAPGIVNVEGSIAKNYGSPLNMIFNVPATIVFEKKWFNDNKSNYTITIPTGAKGHIPAGYVFKNSYDQQDYEYMVEHGMEDMFWETHSYLKEGVDYTFNSEESTFVITAENASQIFGPATVYIKDPEPEPDFAGEGTEASPFLIASAEDWNKFATNVNGGNTYNGEYFQLTNNIAISTMVGTSDHNFNGTFDGAGNTITATLSNADCCAPFAYTYGATIKNLHVTGTLTANGTHAGGVVGRNGTESLTLTNVSSSMTIIANATNSNGGLVGYTINATLSGCAFTGKLISEQNRRLGGMVGWKSNTDGSHLTITDCVFDPEEVTSGNSGSKTFAAYGGGTVTFTNCYYTQAVSADQGKLMHAITAGEGVLVLNTGSATIYNVSGITSYGTGISYNHVLYGGNGDEISLNLSGSVNGYEASTGTLSGTENPYKLTMADADCQINKLTPDPTAVDQITNDKSQMTNKVLRNGMLLIEKNGKIYNAQGAEVR